MPAVVQTSSNRIRHQDNRRGRLLDAAAKLFRERGYHNTSMRDIARAVGMLSGSIYYHFASKDEMLLAVYEEGVRHMAEAVDAAVATETEPWSRLSVACAAHLKALLAQSDYTQVMIRVLPQDGGRMAERLTALRDGHEARFRGLVDDLSLPPSTDRRSLRLMLLGALNWSQVWYRPGGDSPETIAGRFLDIIRQQLDPGAPANGNP